MDIRKLQRAIVDGLEDVKGQDIVVFNTEHLSPLFERVVVASGTSNRQTKALAASVRDAVRDIGGQILSTEGSDNGEWIIVDCGSAVVHVMQPAIRQYYHLEEIWGGKQVKMKMASKTGGLAKASESDDDEEPVPARKKAAPRKAAGEPVGEKKAPARKAAAKPAAEKAVPAKKAAAKKVAAKKAPARKSAAGKTAADAGQVVKTIVVGKPVARKTPARKTASAAAGTQAPARKRAAAKKAPRA